MDAGSSHDVLVWGVRRYKGKRKTTYTLRWRVGGRVHQDTFATSKMADAFRARLLLAAQAAELFDIATGMPHSAVVETRRKVTWLSHAMEFVDAKWPHASPRHRKGIAEGLVTATVAAFVGKVPNVEDMRRALERWSFNTGARRANDVIPEQDAAAIRWAERHSPSLAEFAEAPRLRRVLDGLALRLDGRPASSSTVARKRSALYSALQYAVEIDELDVNPMDRIAWKPPAHTDVIDRRVVVNPEQARALLSAVRRTARSRCWVRHRRQVVNGPTPACPTKTGHSSTDLVEPHASLRPRLSSSTPSAGTWRRSPQASAAGSS
jgi:hypothetical protein